VDGYEQLRARALGGDAGGRRLGLGLKPYNAVILPIAGRRFSPYALLKHTGQRSGRDPCDTWAPCPSATDEGFAGVATGMNPRIPTTAEPAT
jgi:hypothetical protein